MDKVLTQAARDILDRPTFETGVGVSVAVTVDDLIDIEAEMLKRYRFTEAALAVALHATGTCGFASYDLPDRPGYGIKDMHDENAAAIFAALSGAAQEQGETG